MRINDDNNSYSRNINHLFLFLPAPPYHSRHKVQPASWSYAAPTNEDESSRGGDQSDRYVDLSLTPPYKPPPEGYKVCVSPYWFELDVFL